MFKRNVELLCHKKISSWRKIAMGTWNKAGDPTVYALVELDVGPALDYIEKINQNNNSRVTITHVIAAVIGKVFEIRPDLNCLLRLGRLYQRKSIDAFFQVASDNTGEDLSGTIIRNINQKSVSDIANELNEKAKAIKDKEDKTYTKMKYKIGLIPGMFVNRVLTLTSFILYTLNIWSPLLGTPRDSFGSVMITSVGMLGIDVAYAPLVPYSRVPLLLTVGKITERAMVDQGQVMAKKVIRIGVTLDHRIIDGVYAGLMSSDFKRIFSEPEKYLC